MRKIASAPIEAVVINSKGKEFTVAGRYWGNGKVRLDNPRPERYPDAQFLFTEPEIFDETDPKRLFWLADVDSAPGKLSKFRIKSLLLKKKLVKKRGTRK